MIGRKDQNKYWQAIISFFASDIEKPGTLGKKIKDDITTEANILARKYQSQKSFKHADGLLELINALIPKDTGFITDNDDKEKVRLLIARAERIAILWDLNSKSAAIEAGNSKKIISVLSSHPFLQPEDFAYLSVAKFMEQDYEGAYQCSMIAIDLYHKNYARIIRHDRNLREELKDNDLIFKHLMRIKKDCHSPDEFLKKIYENENEFIKFIQKNASSSKTEHHCAIISNSVEKAFILPFSLMDNPGLVQSLAITVTLVAMLTIIPALIFLVAAPVAGLSHGLFRIATRSMASPEEQKTMIENLKTTVDSSEQQELIINFILKEYKSNVFSSDSSKKLLDSYDQTLV